MSSATDTHDHAHADGAVHAHVSPTWFYAAIFIALLCLTAATVAQSYVDLGGLSIAIVILIASIKAALVATFFMHLKYDNKFHALIFISTLLFIGVFFAYTMNDTDRRGELDPDQNVKILPKSGEVAPGGYIAPVAESAHEGAAPAPGAPHPAEHH